MTAVTAAASFSLSSADCPSSALLTEGTGVGLAAAVAAVPKGAVQAWTRHQYGNIATVSSHCWSVMCQTLIRKSRLANNNSSSSSSRRGCTSWQVALVRQSLLQQASHVSAVVLSCGLLICNTYICQGSCSSKEQTICKCSISAAFWPLVL